MASILRPNVPFSGMLEPSRLSRASVLPFRLSSRPLIFPPPLPRKHPQPRLFSHSPYYFQRPQYKRFSAPSRGLSSLFYRWAARPTFYREIGYLTAGAAGIYLYNLETVPVSGRRRFNIISPGLEASLGAQTVESVRAEYGSRFLPDHDPRVRQVKRVLERLVPYAEAEGLQGVEWEVNVIDSPEQNAFVAPGGKVFVFTGILPLCGGEDGIAAVLGHEIAHVVAHHTAERMSQAPLILLGTLLLLTLDLSFSSSSLLLNLFLSMPASRKQEAEADYIGLLMMAQGCYDPEAALRFWNRMEKSGQAGPPQILSTHPSNHNREEKIREWLGEAREVGERSECGVTRQYADQFGAAFGSFARW